MFNGIIEKYIRKIIKETAEQNNVEPDTVQFSLKLNKKGEVEVYPFYNGKVHPKKTVKELFNG